MKTPRFLFQPAGVRLVPIGLLLFTAACTSERRSGRLTPETVAAVAAMPEMEAHGAFLAGQLETEVLFGHGGFAAADAARSGNSGEGGGRRGGGFSGGMGGMGGGRRGGRGGGGSGGGAGGGGSAREGSDGEPVPVIRPVNAPPVQFHLRLTNHGPEPLDVEVADFNSELGNFVVQPRKITVPAGGSVEADPMTSRLGVSADEIPLTVTIHAAGKTEKQVLTLRPKPAAPPAAS